MGILEIPREECRKSSILRNLPTDAKVFLLGL